MTTAVGSCHPPAPPAAATTTTTTRPQLPQTASAAVGTPSIQVASADRKYFLVEIP